MGEATDKPVAYLHTLRMEFGQKTKMVTFERRSPFGVPGKDHSKSFKVTTEPLYTLRVAPSTEG